MPSPKSRSKRRAKVRHTQALEAIGALASGKALKGAPASRYRALGVDLGTPSLRTADGSVMTAKIAARAKQPEEDETGSGD